MDKWEFWFKVIGIICGTIVVLAALLGPMILL